MEDKVKSTGRKRFFHVRPAVFPPPESCLFLIEMMYLCTLQNGDKNPHEEHPQFLHYRPY